MPLLDRSHATLNSKLSKWVLKLLKLSSFLLNSLLALATFAL